MVVLAHDIDKSLSSMENRLARCAYFGKPPLKLRDMGGCKTRSREEMVCRCQEPSSTSLWFFSRKLDKDYDEFYCGCHGYD